MLWQGWRWLLPAIGLSWLGLVVVGLVSVALWEGVASLFAGGVKQLGYCSPPDCPAPASTSALSSARLWSSLLAVLTFGLLAGMFVIPHEGRRVWVRFGILLAFMAASSAVMLLAA
jgi:hypothetical protein